MAQVVELSKIWPSYGDQSLLQEVTECEGPTGSLAQAVLDAYDIAYTGSLTGGNLYGLDIKRMDAMSVIQLSLLDSSAGGQFIEPIVNEEGVVEFVQIGADSSSLGTVYFITNSSTYREACAGVMITGQKSLTTFRDLVFKPIWGNDPLKKQIYDTYGMLENCNKPEMSTVVRIVFNDPHLASDYEDGITNFYEINKENPDDKIIGYVHYCDMSEISTIATVGLASETSIPIKVSGDAAAGIPADLGTLIKVPQAPEDTPDASCWASMEKTVPPQGGIKVPIPDTFRWDDKYGKKIDKFIKISGVFVVGQEIDYIHVAPASAADAVSTETSNYNIYLNISDRSDKIIKLREKLHYAVYDTREGDVATPYIVFGADVRTGDPATYGNNVSYQYAFNQSTADAGVKQGTILPHSKTRGILVKEVWALVDIQTPSIVVQDPTGRAKEIAESLTFSLAALVAKDPQPPVVFCDGTTTVVKPFKRDHDPTTTQNIDDSDMDIALDKMQGLGLSLSLSFMDETRCKELAQTLYDYMNHGDVVETIYTCGPQEEPRLGQKTGNGIINAIKYSYTDQGSYTISVTVGGYLVGNLATIDGGLTQKMVESFQSQGVIIEDVGNGIHYKVSLDGLGDRMAVSMCPTILRVGDIVSCSVHNCPVEA